MDLKTQFSEKFNNCTPKQQTRIVLEMMGSSPLEFRPKIFIVLCDDRLWTKNQIDELVKIRDNMTRGSVHIGASTMRKFKEGWGKLRNLLMIMKRTYDSLDGSSASKFFIDLAKMYAYLHNGNMERYDYYTKKVLAKLNDIMTDSMDDDFVLFGLSGRGDKNWELNTDRATLKLANMMQSIQLHNDVFMTLRHGSVPKEECDFIVEFV